MVNITIKEEIENKKPFGSNLDCILVIILSFIVMFELSSFLFIDIPFLDILKWIIVIIILIILIVRASDKKV